MALVLSEVGDLLPAEGTAVLAFSDPLLDALCVEDMLVVAVKCGHEIVSKEVAPANWALSPEAARAFIHATFLLLLCLLVLELRLLQRGDNLRHRQRDGQQPAKHAFHEEASPFFLLQISNFFLELIQRQCLSRLTVCPFLV